jgi:hypothetical protein
MSNCVFQSNRFDYFLGTEPTDTGTVTFIKCVLDIHFLNTTLSLSFSTTDCTYQLEQIAARQRLRGAVSRWRW